MTDRRRFSLRLLLIPVFQAAMVSALLYSESSPHRWLPNFFGVVSLLLPFIAYMAAAYRLRVFGKWTRTLRAGVSTLVSILATMGGYILLFVGGLWMRGDFSTPNSAASESIACVCGVTNWFKFSPKGDGFSILMPFRPTTSTMTNDTAAGSLVLTTFTAEPSRVVAFSVLHNRFPAAMNTSNKQQMFEAGLKSALGTDGKLVSDTTVQLRGYKGHEWKFEKFKGQAVITMRVYLVDHELFQAICLMPKSRLCPRHSREFLDSFDLTQEAKNATEGQPPLQR